MFGVKYFYDILDRGRKLVFVLPHYRAAYWQGRQIRKGAFVYARWCKSCVNRNPTLVYSGKWRHAEKTHTLTWEKAEGFLLNINPQTVYASGEYTTDLFWTAITEKIT